jgi:hypothetical protein
LLQYLIVRSIAAVPQNVNCCKKLFQPAGKID